MVLNLGHFSHTLFQREVGLQKGTCLFPVLREHPVCDDPSWKSKLIINSAVNQRRTLPEFSDTSVSLFRIC